MVGFVPFESSPMRVNSLSVDPGDNWRSSYASNQNAWQTSHISTATPTPECASRVNPAMTPPQLGQFTIVILSRPPVSSVTVHPPSAIRHPPSSSLRVYPPALEFLRPMSSRSVAFKEAWHAPAEDSERLFDRRRCDVSR